MDRELFRQIVSILQPEMEDERYRKSLVEGALHGYAVLSKIQWGDSAGTFTVRLVRELVNYGEVALGKPAIAALLEEVRKQVGLDRQEQFDAVLRKLPSPAKEASSGTRAPQAPSAREDASPPSVASAAPARPADNAPMPGAAPDANPPAKTEPTVEAAKITGNRAMLATILAAVITALGALSVALTNQCGAGVKPSPTPVAFTGRVSNRKEEKIRGAKVSLEGEGVPVVVTTDSEGVFSFRLNDPDKEIHLRIEADGYQNADLRVVPARSPGFRQDILLTPRAAE
ncbi:MAG: carboxypeptidase regulatory-like domain-containing protein [Blastocatellia bacterium]